MPTKNQLNRTRTHPNPPLSVDIGQKGVEPRVLTGRKILWQIPGALRHPKKVLHLTQANGAGLDICQRHLSSNDETIRIGVDTSLVTSTPQVSTPEML